MEPPSLQTAIPLPHLKYFRQGQGQHEGPNPNISQDTTSGQRPHSRRQRQPDPETTNPGFTPAADNRPPNGPSLLLFPPPSLPTENSVDIDPRALEYIRNESYHNSKSEITDSVLLREYPSIRDLLDRGGATAAMDYHDTLENANTKAVPGQRHGNQRIQYQRGPSSHEPRLYGAAQRSTANNNNNRKDGSLWTNLLDKLQETQVDASILRASAKWILEDWQSMEQQSDEALNQALELGYTPLIAKCNFYKGVAEYEQRLWSQACASFADAFSCQGKYPEGDEVAEWMEKARAAQVNSLPLSEKVDVGEQMLMLSSSRPTSLVGIESRELPAAFGGENPPDFSEEDEEEEEEEEEEGVEEMESDHGS